MVKNFLAAFFFVVCVQLTLAPLAYAGFGITPPYVRNTSLTRNSVYEQQILMVRSDPREELEAQVTIDAPDIADWIEIVEGDSVLLPSGAQKVPLTVRVTIPNDADFKTYEGDIRIKTTASGSNLQAGSVNISLGAQIDVALTVIDKEIFDFRVRKIDIKDLNAGHKVGWLYYPGKINFGMRIENTGNVSVAPSNVVFKIYDNSGDVLLEEIEHTNRITKVDPFATEDVVAELPTRLPAGSYLARYAIYNDDEIKQEGEVTLSILPYGTLQQAGYGFMGLSVPHKVSILLPVITLLTLAGLAFRLKRSKRRK